MIAELTPSEMDDLLRAEVVGRIGCHADGQTYVVPITYAYDGGVIYCHSAEGMKVRMMRKSPRVCFEIDRMDGLARWRSVIAWGTFEELAGDEATRAMRILMTRLLPLTPSGPSHGLLTSGSARVEDAGPATIFFRLVLDTKTGRSES